jgi:hypothetical protein
MRAYQCRKFLSLLGANPGKLADAPDSRFSVPACHSIYKSLYAAMLDIHMTVGMGFARYEYIYI